MPHQVFFLDEIEQQFATEFDYHGEAANLTEVADAVMPVYGDRVCIPRPVAGLCTRAVLTMEFVDGRKLVDGVRAAWRAVAARLGTTLAALEEQQARAMRDGPAAVARDMRRLRWWLRYQRAADWVRNAARLAWNLSPLRFVAGAAPYQWTPDMPDLAAVFHLLIDVHAYELFNAGAFNGDPHPGNVLLMRDGRLGLIDYGQVKRLGLADRLSYGKAIIALAEDARDEVGRLAFEELGGDTRYRRLDIAWRLMAFYNDRDTDDVVAPEGRRLSIQEFADWCEAQDPGKRAPPACIMAGRMATMLRSAALAFGVQLRVSPLMRPHAEALLREHGVAYDPHAARAA